MLQPVVDTQGKIARSHGIPQSTQRRERNGREVNHPLLAEYPLKLRRCEHHQLCDVSRPFPLRVAVAGFRQVRELAQHLADPRVALEFADKVQHGGLVGGAGRESHPHVQGLSPLAALGEHRPRKSAPATDILEPHRQPRLLLAPLEQIRARRTCPARRTAHEISDHRHALCADESACPMQDPGYEQRQILVEVRPQQIELRFAQGVAGAQPTCEQRQPAIAGGEHVGEQIDQGQPALIVEFEHALYGASKIILALVGKRTARGLSVEEGRYRPPRSAAAQRAMH